MNERAEHVANLFIVCLLVAQAIIRGEYRTQTPPSEYICLKTSESINGVIKNNGQMIIIFG
jgi:hypothetical protein